MDQNKVKRIDYIDALKGFGIFCVLWAHCVQNFKDGLGSWVYPVNEYILSFVMPLFFVLSGLFFRSSLKINLKEFIRKKVVQILFPWFLWSVIIGIYFYFSMFNKDDINFLKYLKFVFGGNLWFLRELFFSYLTAFVFFKIFKKEYLAIILSIVCVLILPFGEHQCYYLPFFISGILIKDNYEYILNNVYKLIVLVTLTYGICLFFWDVSFYSINGQIFDWSTLSFTFVNLKIAGFRFITGISGSLFFFLIFLKLYKDNPFFSYLSKVGKYTLGIYILQVPVLQILLNELIDFPAMSIGVYCCIVTPVSAFLILEFCYLTLKLAGKNKSVELILFGSSFQKYK